MGFKIGRIDITILNKKGNDNSNADELSRLPLLNIQVKKHSHKEVECGHGLCSIFECLNTKLNIYHDLNLNKDEIRDNQNKDYQNFYLSYFPKVGVLRNYII